MVAAIRFWLKSFALTISDELQPISTYIFDTKKGVDPYLEDLNTLWLLHFLIVSEEIASLYHLLFVEYRREKKDFSRKNLQTFIYRKCSIPEQKNVYNDNTVKKDINVLLKTYVAPSDLKSIEDFSALLINLGLIIRKDNDSFSFVSTPKEAIAPEIVLFALLHLKGEDRTVSFDMLQNISLIFGFSMITLIEIIRDLENIFPDMLVFTDNSGIKNVQFLSEMDGFGILNHYYQAL